MSHAKFILRLKVIHSNLTCLPQNFLYPCGYNESVQLSSFSPVSLLVFSRGLRLTAGTVLDFDYATTIQAVNQFLFEKDEAPLLALCFGQFLLREATGWYDCGVLRGFFTTCLACVSSLSYNFNKVIFVL